MYSSIFYNLNSQINNPRQVILRQLNDMHQVYTEVMIPAHNLQKCTSDLQIINKQTLSLFPQSCMSQALENKEGSKKSSEGLCMKCQVRQESVNFESMCSNCLNQNKSQQDSIIKLSNDKRQDQVGYTTPTKPVRQESAIKRQNQLIEAPRKQRIKKSQASQSEETNKNERVYSMKIRKCHKIRRNKPKQFLSQDEQLNELIDKKDKFNASISEIQPIFNQKNTNTKIETKIKEAMIFQPKGKHHQIKIKRDVEEINDQLLRPNKRTFEQFIDIGHGAKGRCSICKKKTGLLGISCSHCNHQYCNAHRLPQDHQCKANFYQDSRAKMREVIKNLLPKHKGKISEI